MSEISSDQLTLLLLLQRSPQGSNWYKLGRVAIGRLSSPAVFTDVLKSLVANGWVEELEGEVPAMPNLVLTVAGRRVVERA